VGRCGVAQVALRAQRMRVHDLKRCRRVHYYRAHASRDTYNENGARFWQEALECATVRRQSGRRSEDAYYGGLLFLDAGRMDEVDSSLTEAAKSRQSDQESQLRRSGRSGLLLASNRRTKAVASETSRLCR
jgi:hypothetical protein